MPQRDFIEPFGRICEVTAKAIRFHFAVMQPPEIPEEVQGRTLWFPRRRCVPFRDHNGDTRLSISRSYLLEKIAEDGPRQIDEKSWVA